jgi:hypothetical protein
MIGDRPALWARATVPTPTAGSGAASAALPRGTHAAIRHTPRATATSATGGSAHRSSRPVTETAAI